MSSIEIPLGRNKFAIIDNEDLELVMRFKWRYQSTNHGNGYAVKSGYTTQSQFWMHHYILNFDKYDSLLVDHKNGNGLDNRKINLRIATVSQNNFNRKKGKGENKYKGVYKRNGKYYVYVGINNKQRQVGIFDTEIEAAMAYDKKALELSNGFAALNVPFSLDVVV